MTSTVLTTETMKFTDARQQLSQVVNRVARHETRVLIEKSGVPVAALVSADDLRRLNELEARRQEQIAAMFEISRAFADVPDDELERELARAQAEARAELRAEREAASPR
jgi:prevent-host-death family protein